MFEPNYQNILDAAWNKEAKRLPLYEHIISFEKVGEMMGVKDLTSLLLEGDERSLREFFRIYCAFFKKHGYDTVSFEACICGGKSQEFEGIAVIAPPVDDAGHRFHAEALCGRHRPFHQCHYAEIRHESAPH